MRKHILPLALLALPTIATAQEIESMAGVRLTFDRAGARSLAMGSTGIAAKDPDIAATNPAAIAGAPRSFSIETRRRSLEGRYISDASLNTMGIGSSTSGIRSASLTVPMAGATWSLFYDEPLEVHHSTASAVPNFATTGLWVCGRTYVHDLVQRAVGDVQRPTAWSLGPLAIGASVRREHLRQQSVFVTRGVVPTAYGGTAETTDDTSYTWGAGATWSLGAAARAGAVYSSGGSFAGMRTFPAASANPIELRTPPSLGVGVSIDPLPQLTLSADAVRVRYSVMMHDHRNVFPQGSEIGYLDVTELHAGAEYRVGGLALRAGWWRDPAHALAIRNGIIPPPPFHYIPAIVDSSENHLTAGIGIGTKTRFDASIDRASRSTRLALGVSTAF